MSTVITPNLSPTRYVHDVLITVTNHDRDTFPRPAELDPGWLIASREETSKSIYAASRAFPPLPPSFFCCNLWTMARGSSTLSCHQPARSSRAAVPKDNARLQECVLEAVTVTSRHALRGRVLVVPLELNSDALQQNAKVTTRWCLCLCVCKLLIMCFSMFRQTHVQYCDTIR